MKSFTAATLFCILMLVSASATGGPVQEPKISRTLSAATDFHDIIQFFSGHDVNQDGISEIESLQILSSPKSLERLDPESRLLLVIVESRLLANDKTLLGNESFLEPTLQQYEQLLRKDGWNPVLIEARMHASDRHQDGLSVLALRRLFQQLKANYARFSGAVFVGSFPEAMLVRRWIWKRKDRPVNFGSLSFNTKGSPAGIFLAIKPELISKRSDVVLCDLDGNWEDIYCLEPTVVESITVMPEDAPSEAWPNKSNPFETTRFHTEQRTFTDFFFINDSDFRYETLSGDRVRFFGNNQMLLPEVGGKDLLLPNPLATPDIMVSRINPLHVAVNQPAEYLDEAGRPKTVPQELGSPNQRFHRDPRIELQLLREYFHRNFSHRLAVTNPEATRVALLTTDLQTPSQKYFSATSQQMQTPIANFPNSTAVDFVRFITTPAIVKGVSAHSNPSCSVLLRGYDSNELDAVTGGAYWHWKEKQGQFVPSYNDKAVRDKIHFALLRTLWANGKLLETGPAFYVHGGCEAICPAGAHKHPFNAVGYSDQTQIAECLMYYGNGLALIGRAKVYFDIPSGFGSVFTLTRGNFGDVLKEYFRRESQNAKLAKSVASRNRTYFWSILGDWTLRLNYCEKEWKH